MRTTLLCLLIGIGLMLVMPVMAEDWSFLNDGVKTSFTAGDVVHLAFNFTNTYATDESFLVIESLYQDNPNAALQSPEVHVITLNASETTQITFDYTVSNTDSKGIYTWSVTIQDENNSVVAEHESNFEIYGTLSTFSNAIMYACDSNDYCANSMFFTTGDKVKIKAVGVESSNVVGYLNKDGSKYADLNLVNYETSFQNLPAGAYEVYANASLVGYADAGLYTSFTVSSDSLPGVIAKMFSSTTVSLPDRINILQGQHEIVRVVNGVRYSTFVTPPASSSSMHISISNEQMGITYYTSSNIEAGSQLVSVDNVGLQKLYLIKIK